MGAKEIFYKQSWHLIRCPRGGQTGKLGAKTNVSSVN